MCKTIKSSTFLRYLSASAELSIPASMMNPCWNTIGNQSNHITAIIKELKRWKYMPNRRETVTKEMVEYIIKKGKNLQNLTQIIFTLH